MGTKWNVYEMSVVSLVHGLYNPNVVLDYRYKYKNKIIKIVHQVYNNLLFWHHIYMLKKIRKYSIYFPSNQPKCLVNDIQCIFICLMALECPILIMTLDHEVAQYFNLLNIWKVLFFYFLFFSR